MAPDTIAAIATPLGEGGIGVIRISGPASKAIIRKIFRLSPRDEISPNRACHGWLFDGRSILDEAVITYFKGPKSYTGEDVVEISCHGGPAVLKAALELTINKGARLASRGEFTKRAFLNGKIDLAQAEAVVDLIRARTKESSILAASQLKGSLSARIKNIRGIVMGLLAEIEVSIDYPDEARQVSIKRLMKTIKGAQKVVDNLLRTSDRGAIYRNGLSVAIVGKPNVGKSSLLNALLRQDRAIVAEEPGTTRDVIEESYNINGMPIRIMDMAGIRHSKNRVEMIGIERASNEAEKADLILLVMDISRPMTRDDRRLLAMTPERKRIIVLNKSDKKHMLDRLSMGRLGKGVIRKVSALRGDGIRELEEAIAMTVSSNKLVAQNMDVMINLRQKQCLCRAKEQLVKAEGSISRRMPPDFISIDLKGALAALGEVAGEAVSNEVIDTIFERFCVGK